MFRSNNIRALAEKQTGMRSDPDAPILRLDGKRWIFVNDGRVHHWTPRLDESVELAGVRVEVSATGQLSRQFAPGRALAFGILASSKKNDSRQVFLVAEGADGAFVVSLHPDALEAATRVAVGLNAAGRQIIGTHA
jgi:hypothetical protein